MADDEEQRTKWVERYAAEFAGVPFIREFVFPNPQHLRKGIQKEVCDLLVSMGDCAIVVQLKAQEDPAARDSGKLSSWIVKKAQEAADQLSGSLRTLDSMDVWCPHPRRGRVEFKAGQLRAIHGIALVECGQGKRIALPNAGLETQDVPLTYLDASDFLNLIMQLRSFKDIERYLAARTTLGDDVRRYVGGEQVILEHYLLIGDGGFAQWSGYDDAKARADRERSERDRLFQEKHQRDIPATFTEYVADTLATRLPEYRDGLDAATLRMFDADENRQRYLLMQEVLASFSLVGRRQLGAGLLDTFGPPGAAKPSPCIYRALWADEMPDVIFVAVSTTGIPRPEVISRALVLLGGALAHFGRRDGMVIVDRDSTNFEIALVRGYTSTEADQEAGRKFFASLRVADVGDHIL
jgi:hypothetical protein